MSDTPPSANDESICPICLDECDIETGSKQRCGHSFHEACIQPWLAQHKTCPVCRERLVDESVEETRSDRPIVLSLEVDGDDVGQSNVYRHACFTFVLVWLLNGRPLLALWSLTTLGRHTRCSMITNIVLGFILSPELLFFSSRADVTTTLVQCILLYIQMALWLYLWRPFTTVSVIVDSSPQPETATP